MVLACLRSSILYKIIYQVKLNNLQFPPLGCMSSDHIMHSCSENFSTYLKLPEHSIHRTSQHPLLEETALTPTEPSFQFLPLTHDTDRGWWKQHEEDRHVGKKTQTTAGDI